MSPGHEEKDGQGQVDEGKRPLRGYIQNISQTVQGGNYINKECSFKLMEVSIGMPLNTLQPVSPSNPTKRQTCAKPC